MSLLEQLRSLDDRVLGELTSGLHIPVGVGEELWHSATKWCARNVVGFELHAVSDVIRGATCECLEQEVTESRRAAPRAPEWRQLADGLTVWQAIHEVHEALSGGEVYWPGLYRAHRRVERMTADAALGEVQAGWLTARYAEVSRRARRSWQPYQDQPAGVAAYAATLAVLDDGRGLTDDPEQIPVAVAAAARVACGWKLEGPWAGAILRYAQERLNGTWRLAAVTASGADDGADLRNLAGFQYGAYAATSGKVSRAPQLVWAPQLVHDALAVDHRRHVVDLGTDPADDATAATFAALWADEHPDRHVRTVYAAARHLNAR